MLAISKTENREKWWYYRKYRKDDNEDNIALRPSVLHKPRPFHPVVVHRVDRHRNRRGVDIIKRS